MVEVQTGWQNFLLALSALFSIVNPPASSLIFAQATADRSHAERLVLARRIGLYSSLVMLGSLWGGAYVLRFFGVTLPALRIAGGLVVASRAWIMLSAEEKNRARKRGQASQARGEPDVAFFPLTMPFTTGPGTISVAIALGSSLPVGTTRMLAYVFGSSLAAVVIAGLAWLCYASADRITGLLGENGAQVLTRLSAFLLLCIGVQITIGGVTDAARLMLQAPPAVAPADAVERSPARAVNLTIGARDQRPAIGAQIGELPRVHPLDFRNGAVVGTALRGRCPNALDQS